MSITSSCITSHTPHAQTPGFTGFLLDLLLIYIVLITLVLIVFNDL